MQVFRQVASIKRVYNAVNKGFQEDAELLWAAPLVSRHRHQGSKHSACFHTVRKCVTVACDAAFYLRKRIGGSFPLK